MTPRALAGLLENDENVPKPDDLKAKMEGVSLAKDKQGYYVYTHRCRSDSYPDPHDIPQKEIDYIESTG